jgi:hypothetical protein
VSRSLSSPGKVAIHGRTPGDGEILLIAIAHADITTLRYAAVGADTGAVAYGGNSYAARSFRLPLPTDDDGIGETTLDLDITDLADATVAGLLATTGARPTVTAYLVLASTPTTAEATFYFEMKNGEANLGVLRAALTYEPLLARPFPGYTYTAETHPDLFEGAA